jgi:hypothetical protein
MVFKYKLSKRLAISRCLGALIPAAVILGCDAGGQAVTEPAIDEPAPQLSIVPIQHALDYGEEIRFQAYNISASGDSSGATVTWRASDGRMSAEGVYAADTVPGQATVTAERGDGVTATTQVGIGYSGSPVTLVASASRPAQVTDLGVASVDDTMATLKFTEVDDGTGQPARYDIRYTEGPMGWGSAASVAQGTCATPVEGSEIGAERTCTVTGLTPETAYEFRLVAYRGTLEVDAVFSKLSNGADATTDATPVEPELEPEPVASVAVDPSSLTFDVDGTSQLEATVQDAAGNTLTDRAVTWSSSADGVATVSADGLVTAVAEGSATITATSEGKSGTAAVTVTAPVVVTDPGQVTDLAVAKVTETSVTLAFTEVSDGAGELAQYEVRFAPVPLSWGSAAKVTRGSCATPLAGTSIGASRACTVEGLAAGTAYEVQLVAYRGTLSVDAVFGQLSNTAAGTTTTPVVAANGCTNPAPEWLWCDDFEEDQLDRYFEYSAKSGSFTRAAGVGRDGSVGMRARFAAGQVDAGALHLAIGRTPQAYMRPVDAGTANHREIFWRMYLRNQPGWIGGGGYKLSRATSLASSTWAQAMAAHVWSGSSSRKDYLLIDPASGTTEDGTLVTTKYNDFANLRWLGSAGSSTPIFDGAHVGAWYCIEARVRLNDAGYANGAFELWIDGQLEARRTGLNWVGSFDAYGINAVYLENYWDAGSPQAQERYMDDFVVSTARIGC